MQYDENDDINKEELEEETPKRKQSDDGIMEPGEEGDDDSGSLQEEKIDTGEDEFGDGKSEW